MASRLELHTKLEVILGSKNVYYQPPESMIMVYPAIVYSRDTMASKYANDNVYNISTAYEVIVIDRDPDSEIPGRVALLPTCKFNANYTKDNLNHDAFTIQF
jgi:hypothetical protein